MFIILLATAVFIRSISLSSAAADHKTTAPLANCTNYKNCIHPFDQCDSFTGACQLTSRSSTPTFNTFWEYQKFNLDTYDEKYTSIVCSEDGNYPSRDCRYFYQCVNGSSVLKTCDSPGFPYFDPALERCASSSKCPAFRCFERFDVRVGLEGQSSSFFAYCLAPMMYNRYGNSAMGLISGLNNVVIPYVVTRCYGKDVLDVNTGRCEPRCIQEGSLPDTSDCTHYFLCSLADPITSVFTMVRLSCPQGQAFLSREDRCVPEERVSTCTTPRAWPL